MKYFATVKHHSVISKWEEVEAKTLAGAKRQATKDYGNGYVGHIINLIECPESECDDNGPINLPSDYPAHTKVIGSKKWEAPKW